MAQMQASRPMAAPVSDQQGNSIQKATYFLGALTSVALVVGVTVWGVQTMTRDVSGVPVVEASKGPMRVTPDDPGGQQAQHQGFSVNDVAADGTAADPADRLILAPEPLDLSFEKTATITEAPTEEAEASNDGPQTAAADATEGDEGAKMRALADALAEGVEPLETLQPASMQAASAPAVKGGIGRSLRPRVRPATFTPADPEAVMAETGQGTRDVAAASIPVGTRLAQLGAFKSEDIAREEWTRLETRFGDYLEGKDRVIQKAESGGRTFYRLRAMGFEDLADARRFCSALVAERAECIPVVTR